MCGRLREIIGARSPTAPDTPHSAIFRASSRFDASCVWQNLRAVGSARRSWRALLSVLAGDPSQARERLPEPPHSMWLFAPFWSRMAPNAPPPPSGRAVSPSASALLSAGALLWGNTFPPPLFAAPWGWKSLPRHRTFVGFLSVLRCRALYMFRRSLLRPLQGRAAIRGVALGPPPQCSVVGGPPPLLLLPPPCGRAPATAVGGKGDRCPAPTGRGFFVG